MSWRKAPVTWTVVALNFLVLLYTNSIGLGAQADLEEMLKKKFFIVTQGRVYAQYLEHNRSQYPPYLLALGEQANSGEKDRAEILGQLAFRDLAFMNQASTIDFQGDKVAFRHWQKEVEIVRELQSEHPSYTLGLNAEDMSLNKWLSYIFVHSGAFHFLGNMLFLLIFGAALELQIGGLAVLVVFLMSGAFAAGVFAVMTGVTSSPLVGASGAVSGIMTLYCLLNWGRPERYFYWLFLPFRGFMGFVFLPAWVGLLMWAINDLAGYFSTVNELGGVAHTAHLGGEFAGAVVAITLFVLRKIWPSLRPGPADPQRMAIPMGVLYPFLPRQQQ
jgi:membrane associated rhomboid family serine protease